MSELEPVDTEPGKPVHDGPVGGRTDGPLLVVDDLHVSFPTDRGLVRAVDGVSFTLEQGRTLGVVGESGSGKTVLSRAVMGLLPHGTPQTGSVRFEGRDLRTLSPEAMRNIWGAEIAMVFQDPMTSLNPVVKIGRQLTEGLRHHLHVDKREARGHRPRAAALGRHPRAGAPAGPVPASSCRAGCASGSRSPSPSPADPKLLLADEPTTALDVTVQAQILDLLQDKQRERYMAMILVTHDLGVVAGRTDHIAVMYAGKIVETAPTDELFGRGAHAVHRGPAQIHPAHRPTRATPGSRPSAGGRRTSPILRRGAGSRPGARTPRTGAGWRSRR